MGTCRGAGPWGYSSHARGGGSSQADPSLCAQSRDAGTYTCTAENPVGRAHRRVHLTILALPVFTTLPGDCSLRLGDRLWLHCAARGSPTPRLGWTVNGRPVTGLVGWGLRTLGGGGGRAEGEIQPGGEEEGVSQPCGLWVSRLGPVRAGTANTRVAVCDQSVPCQTWQGATSEKDSTAETSGPGQRPVFRPRAAVPIVGPSANPFPRGSVLPPVPR